MPAPRVSIVAYLWNSAAYVDAMMRSVLDQTYRDFELFVLDDGSTDTTPQILECYSGDPRVRIERQHRRGRARLHETFNRCLEATQGEYVAIANGDDWFFPEKIARQVELLDQRPEVDVSFHDALFVDAQGCPIRGSFAPSLDPEIFESRRLAPAMFTSNRIPNPTVMFRRALLRGIGLQEYGWAHDYQFWLKAAVARCRFHFSPERWIRYRVHAESHSTSPIRRERVAQESRRMRTDMLDRYAIEDLYPEILECGDRVWARACAHMELGIQLLMGPDPLLERAAAELRRAVALAPRSREATHDLATVEALLAGTDRRREVHLALPSPETSELHRLRALPERGRLSLPPASSLALIVRPGSAAKGLEEILTSGRVLQVLVLAEGEAALRRIEEIYRDVESLGPAPGLDVQVVRPGELASIAAAHRCAGANVVELPDVADRSARRQLRVRRAAAQI